MDAQVAVEEVVWLVFGRTGANLPADVFADACRRSFEQFLARVGRRPAYVRVNSHRAPEVLVILDELDVHDVEVDVNEGCLSGEILLR